MPTVWWICPPCTRPPAPPPPGMLLISGDRVAWFINVIRILTNLTNAFISMIYLYLFSDGELDIEDCDIESEDMRAFIQRISPSHILAFTTGVNQAPACGFTKQPRIQCVHDDNKTIRCSNTCSIELTLFVNAETITDKCVLYMLTALMNGVVFSVL